MANVDLRVQQAVASLAGNEALFEMLDQEAASEMLDWGIKMSTSIVNETEDLDDTAADEVLQPKLKAVRSSMRLIGNWAAGKYVEPEDRVQLRDKLLERFRTILGDEETLPTPEVMDELLNQAGDSSNTQDQLILKLKKVLTEQDNGEI
ncbi:MAG TPA: hypothetical protein VK851_00885 [Anaerolineales bacterium]|nr:hypothetical protein [Anaerolineales bacterium]